MDGHLNVRNTRNVRNTNVCRQVTIVKIERKCDPVNVRNVCNVAKGNVFDYAETSL